ncbi:MAG: hypothetical protein J7J31_00250 [Helicobacteraceae bacterium]|nr:hypothetical protein [Helicobacteraceae bacterium]
MSAQVKWAVFILLSMLFIGYEQYALEDQQSYQKPPSSYKELNTTVFENFLKQPKSGIAVAHLWGLEETSQEMKKLLDQSDETSMDKAPQRQITQSKNALCIENSCYRLLGFYKQNRSYVSFFNNDREPKIITITTGENLDSLVELKSIDKNTIILDEINASRSWEFKLFDVNTTKYKPKKEIK